jgi:hypothetical protein
MNFLSYASAMRTGRGKNEETRFEDAKQVSAAGSMNIAQVIYDGEWKTRQWAVHAAVPIQRENGVR